MDACTWFEYLIARSSFCYYMLILRISNFGSFDQVRTQNLDLETIAEQQQLYWLQKSWIELEWIVHGERNKEFYQPSQQKERKMLKLEFFKIGARYYNLNSRSFVFNNGLSSSFITAVMEKMGFSRHWIQLIYECVSMPWNVFPQQEAIKTQNNSVNLCL